MGGAARDAARADEALDLIAPRYGVGSLADLLPGVLAALGVGGEADGMGLAAGPLAGVRRVAVVLVDGLGYHLLPRAAPHAPVLGGALAGRYGWLAPATTGFPSTTPVSLVTLGTGTPPGRHGVVGFTVAVPGTDQTFNHITWQGAPEIDPYRWQPVPTAFERARRAGVAAIVVNRPEYAGSGLAVAAYRGAEYRPADGTAATVAAVLAAVHGIDRGLVYAYHGAVDRAAHRTGVASEDWTTAVADADRLVAGIVAGLPPDAALLVTADHGGLDVPAGDRIDVDAVPELTGPDSGIRILAGDSRVRYGYARPGAAADLLAAWRETLAGRALVRSRDEAIGAGWYGPSVDAGMRARIGDVVAACTGRTVLVALTRDPSSDRLVGYHGSLTRVEATVPVLVLRSGEVADGSA
jgi:type I phosphodiesterase/nucleotide pyrophosphatase